MLILRIFSFFYCFKVMAHDQQYFSRLDLRQPGGYGRGSAATPKNWLVPGRCACWFAAQSWTRPGGRGRRSAAGLSWVVTRATSVPLTRRNAGEQSASHDRTRLAETLGMRRHLPTANDSPRAPATGRYTIGRAPLTSPTDINRPVAMATAVDLGGHGHVQ